MEDAALLAALVADDAKVAEALTSLDQYYAALIAAVSAPAAEQKQALAQHQAKLKTANPLVRLCLPAVTGCQRRLTAQETRMLMLRAAADIVVGGPDAVAKHKDPYGDGWMVKFTPANAADLSGLMDAAAYQKYCEERQH